MERINVKSLNCKCKLTQNFFELIKFVRESWPCPWLWLEFWYVNYFIKQYSPLYLRTRTNNRLLDRTFVRRKTHRQRLPTRTLTFFWTRYCRRLTRTTFWQRKRNLEQTVLCTTFQCTESINDHYACIHFMWYHKSYFIFKYKNTSVNIYAMTSYSSTSDVAFKITSSQIIY